MIARGGRLGGAAHGDTAATYAAFNPSRRPRRRDVFETEPCLSQNPLASSSRLELGFQVSRRFYRVFLFTVEDSFSGDIWIGAPLARICVTSLPRKQVRRSCEHAQAQRASRDAVCAAFRTRCAFFNGKSPIGQLPLTESNRMSDQCSFTKVIRGEQLLTAGSCAPMICFVSMLYVIVLILLFLQASIP